MPKINKSLKAFTANIENNIPIVCEATGVWKIEGFFSRIIRKIFCREDARLIGIVKAFNRALDDLEAIPVLFSANHKIVDAQSAFAHEYLQAAEAIQNIFRRSSLKSPQSPPKCLNALARRIASLQYRLESANGGMDPVKVDPELKQKLISAALDWKAGQVIMTNKNLTENELAKLEETCQYPKFAELLLQGEQLKVNFFNWSLRDNNRPSLFIQFPATCQRLIAANLAIRTGRFGSDILQIKKIPGSIFTQTVAEKVVTMPFFDGKNVQHISILDDTREVTLNQGWRLTINKIFDFFTQKTLRLTDLEFFRDKGVMNWHAHELGSWDPSTKSYKRIDLSVQDWIKQLPPVEVISREELEKRYDVKLAPGDWLAVARANREQLGNLLQDRHGFIELTIPNDDGSYCLYSFSKFAAYYPETTLELLSFLLATVPAKVSYPDENIFFTKRQQAAYPIKLNAVEGKKMLSTIHQDLVKGREGNLIFQFRRENCAYWVQSILDSVDTIKTPRLFKSVMVESHSENPILEAIFGWIRQFPKSWQASVVNFTDYLLGGFRGVTVTEGGKKVFKCFSQTPHHEKQYVFQPGFLHKHIEDGTIKGIIFAGHG